MNVRGAVSGDAERLATLLGQMGYPATAAEVARRLRRFDHPDRRLLVAVLDDEVAGLVAFRS